MKAMVQDRYGPPDRLELRDVAIPEVGDSDVLVRVRAASVNPLDWHLTEGLPYLVRMSDGLRQPKRTIPGVDVAGTVESVGAEVHDLAVGDEVFGNAPGSFAEYALGKPSRLARKPRGLSFEEAAAIPVAGVTALQGLRDKGAVTAGQHVLVNGAGGGIGTFAVQIARSMGATVTGVCSARNVDLVRSLGAADVIDYATSDFTTAGVRYDCIIDTVCNHSITSQRGALTKQGALVMLGAAPGNWIGPMLPMLKVALMRRFVSQRISSMFATIRRDDLVALAALVDDGKLTPVVDRTYSIGDAADALRYLETGHARGKTVLTI